VSSKNGTGKISTVKIAQVIMAQMEKWEKFYLNSPGAILAVESLLCAQ